MTRNTSNGHSENGFTLVELLVFSFFSVIILAIAGGMLISSLNVEQATRGSLENSSLDQLISRSLDTGVRGASDYQIDGQLLRARVAVGTKAGAVTWECHAWFYSSATTGFYWARNATGEVPVPGTAADLRVAPWLFVGAGLYLETKDGTFFASDDSAVTMRFKFSPEKDAPIIVRSVTVKPKSSSAGEGPSACF